VIINASSSSVTITWPTEENAETYDIIIKNGDVVFCTLTFNADGQLLNIAFAPARNGRNRTVQYATQTANGLRFTVTGLNEGTHYIYDITAKDKEGDIIQSHSGEFTTKSNVTTDMDNIQSSATSCQKLFRNGQVYILKGGKTYNPFGQEL
jgi:phosphodiesterase/alkaline phosphatase D-like protein